MSQSKMLRTLALALALAAGGCFAQGSDGSSDLGTTEQDVRAPEATQTGEADEPSTTNPPAPSVPRATGPTALSGCDSCGAPVPWAPPPGSLKPHLAPADTDTTPSSEPDKPK